MRPPLSQWIELENCRAIPLCWPLIRGDFLSTTAMWSQITAERESRKCPKPHREREREREILK
jgi:hypothetical protein